MRHGERNACTARIRKRGPLERATCVGIVRHPPRTMFRTAPLLAAMTLAAAAVAQAPYLAGHKDVTWPNLTGQGSPMLFTRVVYPSPTGGVDAPMLANPNGWPVVVM